MPANPPNNRLPDQSRRRLRLPLLLLAVLLFNALAISSLTLYALRGQRAEIDRTREAARDRSLALLSSQVEQALLAAVQTPFLLLKNIRQEDVGAARLQLLRSSFPGVEQVLFLDENLHLKQSFPLPITPHQRLATAWILDRMQTEQRNIEHSPFALHTFVEELDGHPTLFAFQASNELPLGHTASTPDSWILLRFTLHTLEHAHVTSLLAQFARDNSTRVALISPEDGGSARGESVTLNRVLPGWRLTTDALPLAAVAASGQDWTIISVGGGALLAIALTGIAIGWEIRREHALVDLRNRFVASVSHELKTPLSLIRMYTETLYLQRQPDTEKQHEYLGIMLREAERLSHMINDVLSFTRLRSGGEVYQLSATDLATTVGGIIDQYRAHFLARGLRLDLQIEQTLPPVAHDPNGITQILLNLLDNAAKYANAGGLAEVHLRNDDNWIDLSVTDYGGGIDAPSRARLARAYRRGEMVDATQGSGLGLTLVEHITAAHHAHFILDHAEGHSGVQAVISFPVYRGQT